MIIQKIAFGLFLLLVWIYPSDSLNASFVLKLDSETVRPEIVKRGVFRVFGEKLYYLNQITNSIKVFSRATGETLSTITFEKVGPDAVGDQIETFQVISADSILVFSGFNGKKLSLTNQSGRLIRSYNTWPERYDGLYSGAMLATTYGSIVSRGKLVYLSHIIYDQKSLKLNPSLTELNLESGEVRILESLPKIAETVDVDRLAILLNFLMPSIQVGPENKVVLNYPTSNQLYSFDPSLDIASTYKANSRSFDSVKLLKRSISSLSQKDYRNQVRDLSTLSGFYVDLLYNRNERCFYRVTRLPYDEQLLRRYRQGTAKALKPFSHSVIKLDKDLKIVEEYEFTQGKYGFESGIYVDDNGLWVLKADEDNEDEMSFVNVLK